MRLLRVSSIPNNRKTKVVKKKVTLTLKQRRVRGRGDFTSDMGSIWQKAKRFLPRAVGGVLGGMAGNPSAGWNAGGMFSKHVLGWGDYGVPWKVVGNTLMSNGSAPIMGVGKDSEIRVKHKEFIGALLSTTDFSNRVYHINPGQDALFPWLANVAANFQKYRLEGAMLIFESSIPSGIATFSSLGSVILAANLNPSAPSATTQLEMEQMQFAASCKPSENMMAPIECAPYLGATQGLSVRTGDVPAEASINDYDHGTLQIATIGQPSAGVQLGKLYIVYDVVLQLPRYLGPGGTIQNAYHKGASASAAAPFGTSTVEVFDNVGCTMSATAFTFPRGSAGLWEIEVDYTGTAASITIPTITYTSGCEAGPTLYTAGTATKSLIPSSGSQTNATLKFTVKVTDNAALAVVTIGSGTLPTSASADIYVKQLNPLF